jgi:DNA replication protein DnaC
MLYQPLLHQLHELVERQSCRLRQRLRWAKLTQSAALEDLDLKAPRGLDRTALGQVTDLGWIAEHLNVLITGPTGVGKSYIGCAVGHAACRADYSVRFFRIPRLIDELARYAALQNKSTLLRQIAKADLLIIDDFGLAPLADGVRRDLLEILDDRRCDPRPADPQQLSAHTQGRVDAQAEVGCGGQDRQGPLTNTNY